MFRQAKDVVKALKRRLQHRSSKVQLLSLTVPLLQPVFVFSKLEYKKLWIFDCVLVIYVVITLLL